MVLWKYKPKVVAITGSVGKTSTKDAVYAALASTEHVRKSEKSYNSEIGLPLTILGLPNGWNNPVRWAKNLLKGLWLILWPHKYPKWLVLEVGVGKPGDMKKTALWLRTEAVIITAIGETPVHIEFFENREHLIKEKAELIQTLRPEGLLLLNADDPSLVELKEKTLGRRPMGEAKSRVMTFGWGAEADVRGSGESVSYENDGLPAQAGAPKGFVFRADVGGNSLPVVIDGVFGKNHMYASLAAIALVAGLKLNILEAINALKNYDVPPGRMHLLKGIKGTYIIDDTYNSSPSACELALTTLGEVKSKGLPAQAGRKIAVLGDMLELGRHTDEAHKTVGKLAKANADILFTVGLRAKGIKEGAIQAGMKAENIHEFLDSRDAGGKLKDFIEAGDFILIKGSQGMRMERIVEGIMLEVAKKKKLLVRQDAEWLAKK